MLWSGWSWVIYWFPSPFSKPLWSVPITPMMIGLTITLMFHNFLISLARSKNLFLFSIIIVIGPNEFYRCLSGSKSPQVSRTLFSILAVLNNAVVLMISILPLISKIRPSILTDFNNVLIWMQFLLRFSIPPFFFSKSLGTIPSAQLILLSPLPSYSKVFQLSSKIHLYF